VSGGAPRQSLFLAGFRSDNALALSSGTGLKFIILGGICRAVSA
jgi:hypothetical protein